MKITKKAILVLLITMMGCLTLSGCATNASGARMAYTSQTIQKPHNKSFINNIAIGTIGGGKETNPLWESKVNNSGLKEALQLSLKSNNLYSSSDKAKYTLNATLNKLDQPIMGLNMTVKSCIHYNLVNNVNRRVIYNKNINSSYTASWKTLYGVERLQEANEGSIRENIKKFMNDLLHKL